MPYVKQSLIEYQALKQDLTKKLKIDPKFSPEINVKKVMDEK
jgi:hypothetical protein